MRNFPKRKTYAGLLPQSAGQLIGAAPELVRFMLSLQDDNGKSLLEFLAEGSYAPEQVAWVKTLVAREELCSLFGPKELAELLPVALYTKDFPFFQGLLERGADPNQRVNGQTALQRVVNQVKRYHEKEYIPFIDALLAKNANPNLATETSILPLFQAILVGAEAIAIKLLTASSPADVRLHSRNVLKRDASVTPYNKEKVTYFENCSLISCLQAVIWATNEGILPYITKSLVSLSIELGELMATSKMISDKASFNSLSNMMTSRS